MKRIVFLIGFLFSFAAHAEVMKYAVPQQSYADFYNRAYRESKENTFATENTHHVRPYFRRDGTYVHGHLSGNPGSGIHCRDNVCY